MASGAVILLSLHPPPPHPKPPRPFPAPSLSTSRQKSSCSRRVLPEISDGRTPPWTLCSVLGSLTPGATAPLPALCPASAPRSLHVGVTAASSLACLTPRWFRGGALVPGVAMCTHTGSTCAQGGQQKHPSPHPALWSSWVSTQSLESVGGTLAPPHTAASGHVRDACPKVLCACCPDPGHLACSVASAVHAWLRLCAPLEPPVPLRFVHPVSLHGTTDLRVAANHVLCIFESLQAWQSPCCTRSAQ